MAKSTKTTTGAGKTRKARAPANAVSRAPNSTASRRSSRGQTSPLNPTRALQTQREIAAVDRESDPDDTSTDSDSETETPNTRGGGRVSNQLAMPVKPMTELTTKEAERLRTELHQNKEVDAKPWGYLTNETQEALTIRWKVNKGDLPEPLQEDPSTHNGEQFVQLITLLYTNQAQKAESSVQLQIEHLWAETSLTYTQYNEIEARYLKSMKLSKANAMNSAQQKDTIRRIVKTGRQNSSIYYRNVALLCSVYCLRLYRVLTAVFCGSV